MNELKTINADVTMGGAVGVLLVGRYRVVRQLGQGGMGSVWFAEDTKLDVRKVAIKMLPSILVSNKRAYAQVKQEALVSLKLTHPNIVAVRAFEEEGGNPFLVMDYIEGRMLDDYLAEKGKLTEEETVKLLKPVAAALDCAHAQDVYSFMAMAYECLTGTPSFSRGQIEYQIEHDTPASLGEHIAGYGGAGEVVRGAAGNVRGCVGVGGNAEKERERRSVRTQDSDRGGFAGRSGAWSACWRRLVVGERDWEKRRRGDGAGTSGQFRAD